MNSVHFHLLLGIIISLPHGYLGTVVHTEYRVWPEFGLVTPDDKDGADIVHNVLFSTLAGAIKEDHGSHAGLPCKECRGACVGAEYSHVLASCMFVL